MAWLARKRQTGTSTDDSGNAQFWVEYDAWDSSTQAVYQLDGDGLPINGDNGQPLPVEPLPDPLVSGRVYLPAGGTPAQWLQIAVADARTRRKDLQDAIRANAEKFAALLDNVWIDIDNPPHLGA